MLKKDSPLRQLPRGLSARQIVYLDALRLSAEIADQAYGELVTEVQTLSALSECPDGTHDPVPAVRHAWSFIDSLHRFRAVLQQAPGVKHNSVYELFMRQTDPAKRMRDVAQHLNNELSGIAERAQGAYGTLTWVVGAGDDLVPTACMVNAGTAYGRVLGPVTDFEERLPSGEIHHLRIELGKRVLMISDAHGHLVSLVRSFEAAIGKLADRNQRYGSDQVFNLTFRHAQQDAPAAEETESTPGERRTPQRFLRAPQT